MMKCVVKNAKDMLELIEIAMPKPKPNYLLVKVHASPINPSDQGFIKGTYGNKELQPKPPVGIGFEGAGTVVGTGEGLDSGLVGKKVAYFNNVHSLDYMGSWSQFTTVPIDSALLLPEGVDLETASMASVNPKTVMGFYHLIKTGGHKAVLQTAAASALGKMFIRLCNEKNVDIVNVVRKKTNVETLKALGAKYVLDQEQPGFREELAKMIAAVKPTACFEAVGGELAGTIFTEMPDSSTMYVYGSLANPEIIGIKGTDMRYKMKTITGYHVVRLFNSLKEEERKNYMDYILSDLSSGGKIFGTSVAKRVPLEKFNEALSEQAALASTGKILFKPE